MQVSHYSSHSPLLDRREPARFIRNEQCTSITLIVIGILLSLGGAFLLLASFNIFLYEINIISQLGIGGKILGSCIVGIGLMTVIYGIWQKYKSSKQPDASSTYSQGFTQIEGRVPKGFLKSPYSLGATFRFLANHVTNGRLSTTHSDYKSMNLLNKKGVITLRQGDNSSSFKVVFLGDIMVSKSGNPPQLDRKMKKLLKSANVIVANVEAPVIHSTKRTKRGLSLKFEMSPQYLESIYACNRAAQWVFSIANNHACDTSDQSQEDVSGVLTTIESIKSVLPKAEIIGAEIGRAKPVLSLPIENGPKIGIIAWTEVMNNDRYHFKKKIIRENDISEETITNIKAEYDILIGFPHGNEEQSYYPLKETRNRWCQLTGSDKFDLIVGHGPHVVHPAELVEDRLLFHSIGNFCSPVGSSQTRVGCIPEIDLNYDEEGKPIAIHYKVNLLEQAGETVSLLADINETATIYPKIIRRLRRSWGSLFS